MSLTNLTLGLFLVFFSLTLLGILAISNTIIGIVALIAGVLILADAFHPVRFGSRQ